MTTRLILLLVAATVPMLVGFICHSYREGRLARLEPSTGRMASHLVLATHCLVWAWMLFGTCYIFLFKTWSAWALITALAGVMFGSLFGLTVSLLAWHASRPKLAGKSFLRLASKGPLWDAEWDR